MKSAKRILILVLVLLLTVSVLPTAAYADGGCPRSRTGKHDWSHWKVTKAATCTEDGIQTRECRLCRKKQKMYLPATGHDMDEGVITREPQMFVPGEKTFTCRNCGEKRIERLDPTGRLFDQLRRPINGPRDFIDPLVITEHPQGGYVSYWCREYWQSGKHTMSVKAEGGREPYTYQWYQEPIPQHIFPDQLADLIGRRGVAASDAYLSIKNKIKPVVVGWKDGWLAGAEIVAQPGDNPGLSFEEPDISPDTIKIPGATESTYAAYEGDMRYFCVVKDDSGQSAVSNKAAIVRGWHIVDQPVGGSLRDSGSVTLSIRLAGGSGKFNYELILLGPNDPNEPDREHTTITTHTGGTQFSHSVTEPGEYVFYITDAVYGEWGHSDFPRVYYDSPSELDFVPESDEPSEESGEAPSAPAEAPAAAPVEAPAEAQDPEGSQRAPQVDLDPASLPGDWFAPIQGKVFKLSLNADGTYAAAFQDKPEEEATGVWTFRDGEIFLDGSETGSINAFDGQLRISGYDALLSREAPVIYAPAEVVADGSLEGYWVAKTIELDGAVLNTDDLMEPLDVYIEGTNVALGGRLFGDVIVAMAYEDGALTLSDGDVDLSLRLQEDGLLRLSLSAGEESMTAYLQR